MMNAQLINAWKNPAFRATLSESEMATLVANPAGMIELSASDLDGISGGGNTGCGGGGSKRKSKKKSGKKSKKSKKSKGGGCYC